MGTPNLYGIRSFVIKNNWRWVQSEVNPSPFGFPVVQGNFQNFVELAPVLPRDS